MNLKEIAEKVKAGVLTLTQEELSKERMKVCKECPAYKKLSRQCGLCHCFLDVKTRLLDGSCPVNKW